MVKSKLDDMKRRLQERQKEILSRRKLADELAAKAKVDEQLRKKKYSQYIKKEGDSYRRLSNEEIRKGDRDVHQLYDEYEEDDSSASIERREVHAPFSVMPLITGAIGLGVVLMVGMMVMNTVTDSLSSVSEYSNSTADYQSITMITDVFNGMPSLITIAMFIPFVMIILNMFRVVGGRGDL